MSDNTQAVEWYLAREGQQHGPVSEFELQKIIELGYLKPTDLVWRQGMAEWAAAASVFDLDAVRAAAAATAAKPDSSQAEVKPGPAEQPAPSAAAPAPHVRLDAEPSRSPAAVPGPQMPQPRAPRAPAEREAPAMGPAMGHGRVEATPAAPRRPAAEVPVQGYAAPRATPAPIQPAPSQPAPTRPGQFRQPTAAPASSPAPRRDAPEFAGSAATAATYAGPYPGQGAPAPQRAAGPAPAARLQQPQPHPQSRLQPGAQHAPQHAPQAQPHLHARQPLDEEEDEVEDGRGFPWRMLTTLVVLAGLGGGGYALYRTGNLTALPFLGAPTASGSVPVVAAPASAARATTGAVSDPALAGAAQSIDQGLQQSALWQRLKRDFPDWYGGQLNQATKLSGESKTEREISLAMTKAIVELRRKHHADALASAPTQLRAIATTFVENLAQLARHSTAACYGYISQGEASPAVVDLKSGAQRQAIEGQLLSIFDAVADGRKSPVKRDPPRREDYDLLTSELAKLGWSPADLQLFADARALARASPEKVCQMVQDWFAAQLAVKDEAVQMRLLGEALKPVVAG